MLNLLKEYFKGKKILILGFGIEGQSTYKLLRRLFPDETLNIADINEDLTKNELIIADLPKLNLQLGADYLNEIGNYDLVIKTPGISLKHISDCDFSRFTSHTELFIRLFKKQIIGITGTKGKSTTSSLIHHIINTHNDNCMLVGNIGVPPFDLINSINKDTIIVYELSSHQLEQIGVSPHIAIMLNLFEEHLDHYKTFEKYQEAKLNIALFQDSSDYFIINADDQRISKLVSENLLKGKFVKYSLLNKVVKGCYINNNSVFYSGSEVIEVLNKTEFNNLIGEHNLLNIMASVCASIISGISVEHIATAIESYKPLEHRIEFVGKFDDILFYNDSISTIPEATIAAIKSLKNVDTLILGGFDRGISYDFLMNFLNRSKISNLIFIGEAGKRMLEIYRAENNPSKNTFYTSDFSEAVNFAKKHTMKNKICLLSPAAASYDMFKNFDERGKTYKQLVRK
jgi:UDP-N-acetylmuramoyl-L-alanine---L-glutamate ligase